MGDLGTTRRSTSPCTIQGKIAFEPLLTVSAYRCELEPTGAEVGDAFYGHEKKVHLILRNTGQVTANFQFMPLPGAMFGDHQDKAFRTAPRWATIEPEQASCTHNDLSSEYHRLVWSALT